MNIEDLHNRYTVKKFDPNGTVDEATVELLKQTFHLAPSSLNIQAWKLIVVSSKEAREALSAAGQAGNKHRIKNASHVFVFARKRWVGFAHIRRIIEETKMNTLARDGAGLKTWQLTFVLYGYFIVHGMRFWVKQQLYIPLGMMLAVCAERGVGSSPMEGIKIRKANKILGLNGFSTVAVLAVGQPHEKDADNPSKLHKDRLPYGEVVETR
jgi:nitroreductase/dihydropteridine reductase